MNYWLLTLYKILFVDYSLYYRILIQFNLQNVEASIRQKQLHHARQEAERAWEKSGPLAVGPRADADHGT